MLLRTTRELHATACTINDVASEMRKLRELAQASRAARRSRSCFRDSPRPNADTSHGTGRDHTLEMDRWRSGTLGEAARFPTAGGSGPVECLAALRRHGTHIEFRFNLPHNYVVKARVSSAAGGLEYA